MTRYAAGSTAGHLPASKDSAGRAVVSGVDLAGVAQTNAQVVPDPSGGRHGSARNQFVGLVTRDPRGRRDGAGRAAVRTVPGGRR